MKYKEQSREKELNKKQTRIQMMNDELKTKAIRVLNEIMEFELDQRSLGFLQVHLIVKEMRPAQTIMARK